MFSMNSKYLYNEGAGLNLVGGWGAFIAMSATAVMYRNGLYIFLLRQYFKNQPKVLEELSLIHIFVISQSNIIETMATSGMKD